MLRRSNFETLVNQKGTVSVLLLLRPKLQFPRLPMFLNGYLNIYLTVYKQKSNRNISCLSSQPTSQKIVYTWLCLAATADASDSQLIAAPRDVTNLAVQRLLSCTNEVMLDYLQPQPFFRSPSLFVLLIKGLCQYQQVQITYQYSRS